MKEMFVIYNNITGEIDGGAGRIDRALDEKNLDGSTMSERIPLIVSKKAGREVIFLPDQDLPDLKENKIKNGKIVKKTQADKEPAETAQLNEEKIKKAMRKIAIEHLKTTGELQSDFV